MDVSTNLATLARIFAADMLPAFAIERVRQNRGGWRRLVVNAQFSLYVWYRAGLESHHDVGTVCRG